MISCRFAGYSFLSLHLVGRLSCFFPVGGSWLGTGTKVRSGHLFGIHFGPLMVSLHCLLPNIMYSIPHFIQVVVFPCVSCNVVAKERSKAFKKIVPYLVKVAQQGFWKSKISTHCHCFTLVCLETCCMKCTLEEEVIIAIQDNILCTFKICCA